MVPGLLDELFDAKSGHKNFDDFPVVDVQASVWQELDVVVSRTYERGITVLAPWVVVVVGVVFAAGIVVEGAECWQLIQRGQKLNIFLKGNLC